MPTTMTFKAVPRPARYDPHQRRYTTADEWNVGAAVILHPDTLPAAIAAVQRADVAEAHAVHGTDVAAIAEAVTLPVGIVQRRLMELAILPATTRGRTKSRRGLAKRVLVWLTEHGPATVREIYTGMSEDASAINNALYLNAKKFRQTGTKKRPTGGKPCILWDVPR